MAQLVTRRMLIAAGCALPLLALPGCNTVGEWGGAALEPAIRRLLTLSSQRAFANLLREEGFFEDEVARVGLPEELGGTRTNSIVSALLRTGTVQTQLLRLVNHAAAKGAENAAPIVYESIRDMTITDAVSIVRGGPNAATEYLERQIGERIVEALFPGIGSALRLLDSGLLQRVLGSATGLEFGNLQQDVTRKTAQGIWRAIGREEAQIRANPDATGDPQLKAIFGVLHGVR